MREHRRDRGRLESAISILNEILKDGKEYDKRERSGGAEWTTGITY